MEEEKIEVPVIDKSKWPDGPWKTEPDRVEFKHAGLPCLITRHPRFGHLCGYAAVPPGHPLHGYAYGEIETNIQVHGGVTYAHSCSGQICHVPEPGEPADVWWYGFDCGHCHDISPGIEEIFRPSTVDALWMGAAYRDMAYVRCETESLAEQLAGVRPIDR